MGQQTAATLAACLRGGRLTHASLVEGGAEALVFARRMAAAVLCIGDGERPCGVCKSCRKAEGGIHPDLLEFGGGEGARSFHVDEVRNIREQAFIKPNESDAKVFLLKNVQNMSVQAQNALLKIIEEPPAGVYFILTCDNKSALLETTLSRVTVFSLGGSDAESGGPAEEILEKLLCGSELEALSGLSVFEKDRAGFSLFLERLREAVCRLLLHPPENPTIEIGRLQLLQIVDIIDEAMTANLQNASLPLLTTALAAKIKSVTVD